jgi:hypothetical protein
MAKIDRLGWAAGFTIRAHGLRVGIRTNRPEALALLPERLPVGWKAATAPTVDLLYSLRVGGEGPRPGLRHFHLLYRYADRLLRTQDLAEALCVLEDDLRLQVAERARNRLFVHAGVVGWQGRAILIPGRSHAGKTTLVAALVRAGATYYSDEYAVLDARGRVHPFPCPLSLRHGPEERIERRSAAELGGSEGRAPLPVGLVMVTHYRPGAPWRPRPLSPGQAAMALLANTVAARSRTRHALFLFQQIARHARGLKSTRPEAEAVAPLVLAAAGALVRSGTPPPGETSRRSAPPSSAPRAG